MKKIIASILCFIIFFMLLFVVYWFCLPHVVVLQDPAFKLVYEKKYYISFILNLLEHMTGFRLITLPGDILTDRDLMEKELEKYSDSPLVLMSPVVTSSVNALNIDASALINGHAVGISSFYSENFDTVLISDSSSAFDYAEENDLNAVDYRRNFSTERDKFDAVIYPDFSVSVIPLLELEKGEIQNGFLFYDCYIFRKNIFKF